MLKLNPAQLIKDAPGLARHVTWSQKNLQTVHISSVKQRTAKKKMTCKILFVAVVRDGHGGGWSRKINAWHLYTLMVYL
jgi:hypothetical protein